MEKQWVGVMRLMHDMLIITINIIQTRCHNEDISIYLSLSLSLSLSIYIYIYIYIYISSISIYIFHQDEFPSSSSVVKPHWSLFWC